MTIHPVRRARTTTRRDILKTGAAAMLASMAAPIPGFAQAPRKGGELRLALNGGSATDTLDPRELVGTFPVNISRQIYNTLVEIDDEGNARPELAEGWEAQDGNKRWIINLRADVEFHDGKTLDAEDVRYSLGLHMGEETTSAAKSLASDFEEIRVLSPTQIELRLGSPNPDIDYVLSDLHFAIVPSGHTDWSNAIGTGPYRLAIFEPAVRARTERHPNYWRPDRAHVDAVETAVINDMSARIAALQSGAAHIINGVDFKLAGMLERSSELYLVVTEGKQHFTLPMDAQAAPYSDVDVALALKHAINREQIVDLLLSGYGRVGNDQPIAADDPNFNPDIPQRVLDPEKARFHLKKAGHQELSVNLHVASVAFEQAVEAAQIYAESARSCGINLNVVRVPDDGYWSDVWMKEPWTASFWAGRPAASMMFSSVYLSTSPWNETHWQNEEFDRKLLEARTMPDTDDRRDIYFELQRLIHDECPTVIPAFASWVDAARSEVKGFTPNPNFMLSDHRVAEKVWLEN